MSRQNRPTCPLCGGYGPKLATARERKAPALLVPILEAVSEAADVPIQVLLGSRRRQREVDARFVAVGLAQHRLGLSLSELSRLFGKDRSAMRNALAKVRGNARLQGLILSIDSQMKGPPSP